MKNLFYLFFIALGLLIISCHCDDDKSSQCEQCNLIPDPGDCEAAIPRFFYNQQTNQCEEFTWGGCAGVVPFETLQECLDCCIN